MREELEDAGLQVRLQNVTSKPYYNFTSGRNRTRPNVIARTGKGNGTKLILNGHIDTVSGDTMKHAFDPHVVGGKLYGRGSSDMKGGVASIVAAAEAIVESDLDLGGELVLSLVVDEETSGTGTLEFLKTETGDFCIVAEPTNNTLGIAQAGYLDFNIYSKGEARHGQTTLPELWANAFVQASNLCNRILADRRIVTKKKYNGLLMKTTFNFSPAPYPTLPSGAWMTMEEFRINCLLGVIAERSIAKSTKAGKMAMGRIKKKVAESNREGQANRFELLDIKPGFIQAPNAYTKAFERTMQYVLGHHRHSYVYSFCDSSYFYRAGIPTILFGPGRMELGHGTKEYINISQVKDATAVFAHAIENILGSSSSTASR